MSEPTVPVSGPTAAATFEAHLEQLESLVEQLEHGDIPLAEAMAAYERGLDMARKAEALLTEAHKRLEELNAPAGDAEPSAASSD
ncbi:MAG: exodeoxyribonuclease VII small subunit [Oceanococcaceae bacterium]